MQLEAVLLRHVAGQARQAVPDHLLRLANVDAVVDGDLGALGQRVDLDAARDDIHGLRRLHEILDLGALLRRLEGQMVGLRLARVVVRVSPLGEQLLQLVRELGRVGRAALELVQIGVLVREEGPVLVTFDQGDELAEDADAGVVEGDGGMAARGADRDKDVGVSLLGGARLGEQGAPALLERRTFVDDDGQAVVAVPLLDEGG